MNIRSLSLLLISSISVGCNGSDNSGEISNESTLKGLWFAEFLAEDNEDEVSQDARDVYLISIDENGMIVDYDCKPEGYSLSAINMRILDEENKTRYERVTAEESFPRSEAYSLDNNKLMVTLEDTYDYEGEEPSIESSSFQLNRISNIPSTCTDNATYISSVTPSAISANAETTFEINYTYKVEHPATAGNVAQLALEVFSRDTTGKLIAADDIIVESAVITDGSIQNGNFSYTKNVSTASGGTLYFMLEIAYTVAPGPDVGSNITGDISPNDTFFTVDIN